MNRKIVRRLVVGLAMLGGSLPGAATSAATLCRGQYIAGFADAAERGKVSVGDPTTDPARMRIYAEKVAGRWYYQTNVVIEGAPYPAKIVSETPLSLRVVVANMLRRPAAPVMTRAVIVAGAALFEADAPVRFASAE